MHHLIGKNIIKDDQFLDEGHLADKMPGLGHDKKDHMTSGVYSGIES